MQQVKAGQPLRASHINAIIDHLNTLAPTPPATSSAAPFSPITPYTPQPDFLGTICHGTAAVAPGLVYVNGNPVQGDELPERQTSLTSYTSTATHTATPGATAWLNGYARIDPESGTLSAQFRIDWTSSPSTLPTPYNVSTDYNTYTFPILEIRANSSGIPYIHQHFTGVQYITIQADSGGGTATVPLAQYLTGNATKPDTPGKISAIKRIPFADWTQYATTNVDGTIDLSTTGIEKIEDGAIYLREPIQYPLANYTPNTYETPIPGIISGIQLTTAVDSPQILNGIIHLPITTAALGGIRTSSGYLYNWANLDPGIAYKIGESPTYGYNAGQEIHPTTTYAIIAKGLNGYNSEHSFLSIITMVGDYNTTPADLDTIMANTTTVIS